MMTKVISYIFNYPLYIVNIACRKRRQRRAEKVLGNGRLWSLVTNLTGFSPFVPPGYANTVWLEYTA